MLVTALALFAPFVPPQVQVDRSLLAELEGPRAHTVVVLDGFVLDAAGHPAPDVQVQCSAGGSTSTDVFGHYSLETRVTPGASRVEITASASATGLGAASMDVVLPAGLGAYTLTPLALRPSKVCNPSWVETFGGQPGADSSVFAVEVFDSGAGPELYAGGIFEIMGGIPALHIARWDGSTWRDLAGVGIGGIVDDMAVCEVGGSQALYAVGRNVSGNFGHVARWDGNQVTSIGGLVNGAVLAATEFDDGNGPALYIGGSFSNIAQNSASRVARWDGNNWSNLGAGIFGQVRALAVYDDGNGEALYAGGVFTFAGSGSANNIARWDGNNWTTLGSGTNDWVEALEVFDDGSGPKLYVGGQFTQAGGVNARSIASWDGSTWAPVGGGASDSIVYDLDVIDVGQGPRLFAVGGFQSMGGVFARGGAAWDGVQWSSLASGFQGGIPSSVTGFDAGGGVQAVSSGLFTEAGGKAVKRIAAWDGSTWSALERGLDDDALAIETFDDGNGPGLVVGGNFVAIGDLQANRIARWRGGAWEAFAGGVDDTVWALQAFDDGGGEAVYAGGQFIHADGLTVNGIAKWDGSAWSSMAGGLGGGLPNPVRALEVFDDGNGPALYAGGNFTHPLGGSDMGIARWTGSSWASVGGGTNGQVFSLLAHDDGTGTSLYASGSFTTAGGVSVQRIAKWDGTIWRPLGNGFSTSSVVCMASYDDGNGPKLVVGGFFTTAGSADAMNVAVWDGVSWSPLGTGFDDGVSALTVVHQANGTQLVAGGGFQLADGLAASRVARWNGTKWSSLGAGTDEWVFALAEHDDGSGPALFAGGRFETIPGSSDSFLGKWACLGPAQVQQP